MSKSWKSDIDIDVSPNTKKEDYGVRAIIYDESSKSIKVHPSGFYCDSNIPIDKETGMSALDYKFAESLGYIKIDILTNNVYSRFKTKDEVKKSIETEPNWNLLMDESFVNKLPHLANHFEIVEMVAPRSIIELADTLALIRPAKRHLIEKYIKNPKIVRTNLYRKPTNGKYYFKKSHAVSYAVMVVSMMNSLDVKGAFVKY